MKTKMMLTSLLYTIFTSAELHAQGVEVYPGCNPSPITYEKTIIVDANTGDNLQKAIDERRVLPGDRVLVRGNQGKLRMTSFSHPEWTNSKAFLRIDGNKASFESIVLRDVAKIHFNRITISQSSGSLFIVSGSEDIILSNSFLNGGKDSSSWDAKRWIEATEGFLSTKTRCVSVVNNRLLNLRSGIFLFSRGKTEEETVIKGLVKNNILRNISGDFMRPIGSDIKIIGNKGYDGYVGPEDGDMNHDDFIQGFALDGVPYSNLEIVNNYFKDSTSPGRKFIPQYQGIVIFDGHYQKFLVKDNTVSGSAYHGISINGGSDGVIENNTVVSNNQSGIRPYWISTGSTKDYFPSENIIVRNNFANKIHIQPGARYENNAVVKVSEVAQHMMWYDLFTYRSDLRIKYSSPYYGKNIGDPTPR